METFNCTIVGPSGSIYDAPIKSITLPGEEGEFTVLARHASLLTLLTYGIIEVDDGQKKMSIVIDSGYAKVSENGIDVLVEGAVAIEGSNENEISKALEDAKILLHDAGASNMMMASVEAKIEASAKQHLA